MATIDADGQVAYTAITGPFGEKIEVLNGAAQLPSGDPGPAGKNGYLAKYRKTTDTHFATSPTQMGTRVYIAGLGRFLSVDPVEGGTLNNYVYAMGPVNQEDVSGRFIGRFVNSLISAILRVTSVAVRYFRPATRPRVVRRAPARVSSKGARKIAHRQVSRVKSNSIWFSKIEYDRANRRYLVHPTLLTRITSTGGINPVVSLVQREEMWKDIVKTVPSMNKNNIRDQYYCHWDAVSKRAPRKESWNLDEDSPDVGYWSTLVQYCNPR